MILSVVRLSLTYLNLSVSNSGDPSTPPAPGEEPEPGETCLNIIHPNVTEIGPNFGSTISDFVDEPTVMDVGGLKLEKMLYNLDSVATGTADGAGNRLVLDYDVAFNNIHENVDASNEYFVTSGVAIYNAAGDQVIQRILKIFWNLRSILHQIEYAWVSQETLIAATDLKAAPMQYDLKMSHNIPDPWSMQVGESFILEFTITNTNPVTSLEFDIGEMLGHADALTFGKPAVSFGEAYRHDDPVDTPEFEGKLIHLDPLPSNTGTFCCKHCN